MSAMAEKFAVGHEVVRPLLAVTSGQTSKGSTVCSGSPPEVHIIDRTEETDTQLLYAPTPAGLPRSRSLRFIGIAVRRATKPACFSALMPHARARARQLAGHISRWRSARYSALAMLSRTWKRPSCRQGTRALPTSTLSAGL